MILIDEAFQFSIKSLRLLKYLEKESYKAGTLSWKRGSETTASISIVVNTFIETPYLELNYKSNGSSVKYRVQLVSVPSNLRKGIVWFFLCPSTGKRCRKLYLADNYFVSRFALINAMYKDQAKSHKARLYSKAFDKFFETEELQQQICGKHFKTHYAGKSTKRYLQLLKRIDKAEQLTANNLHTLFR